MKKISTVMAKKVEHQLTQKIADAGVYYSVG
jgi:hypothetical protein